MIVEEDLYILKKKFVDPDNFTYAFLNSPFVKKLYDVESVNEIFEHTRALARDYFDYASLMSQGECQVDLIGEITGTDSRFIETVQKIRQKKDELARLESNIALAEKQLEKILYLKKFAGIGETASVEQMSETDKKLQKVVDETDYSSMGKADVRSQFSSLKSFGYYKRLGNSCSACGSCKNVEYHHIVPVSLNGSNDINNVILLCPRCHAYAHKLLGQGHLENLIMNRGRNGNL